MTTQKDERYDGYPQVLAQAAAARQYGTQLVDLGQMAFGARWFYAQGGLFSRVIDLPADLATSTGVTIKGAGQDLDSELDRLKVLPAMSNALRWSLLDGGAALIVMAKAAGTLADPLEAGALMELEEFRVVSVTQMRGSQEKYDDPTQKNYGMPVFYDVDWAGNQKVKIHESRVIEVPGGPMAVVAGVDLRDIPWAGRGISSKAILAIQRYQRGVGWAEKLLERSQQAVHKMKGLAQLLMQANGTGEAIVRSRIDMVDGNRTAINGVAVDSEDDYIITSTTLSGVKDTIGELKDDVAAETGMPVTVLFGRSPGGLNANGDGDWDMVFDMTNQLRTIRLTPALERVISLIYAQSSVQLEAAEDWKIQWNPLKQQTAQQRADVDNKKADTLKKVAEALKTVQETQAISQDEAHAYLASERMFGLEPDDEGGQGAARRYAGQT